AEYPSPCGQRPRHKSGGLLQTARLALICWDQSGKAFRSISLRETYRLPVRGKMVENTEAIWKEYHDSLFAFIRSRVADSITAEDILQDVFVKIHSKIGTLKQRAKLKSWIYQIARNAIIDYYRSHKIMYELPESLPAVEPNKSEKARSDIERGLLPMIMKLPEKYREAIILSEIEGLSQKEIAEKLGLSHSGAKSRIQRGRKLLKEMLLDCCRFEFDRHGNLLDYEEKQQLSKNCGCD
ncbi:RNA polymerase sigma factor SigZ, partial [Candidatus Latescibacterota bacterium]